MAHGVRHRRPRRRRTRSTTGFETELRRGPRAVTAWPATTSRSTAPRFVALDIGAARLRPPDYFRADVQAAVLDALSSGVRADGTLGLFHPDRFTFGQPVYLSAIVRGRAAVDGRPVGDRRRASSASGTTATSALDSGVLPMGRLEIARLDNDPSFPEHGVLDLTIGGGT